MQGSVGNDQGFLIQLKKRLLIEENQIWHGNIGKNSKIDLYAQFKSLLEAEKYLTCIDIFVFEQAMTLLTCSCHSLMIEKSHHLNSREDKLCTEFQVPDNEIHALMYCKKYAQQRMHYLPEVVKEKAHFIQILQSENYFTIQNLPQFILVIIRTNI